MCINHHQTGYMLHTFTLQTLMYNSLCLKHEITNYTHEINNCYLESYEQSQMKYALKEQIKMYKYIRISLT